MKLFEKITRTLAITLGASVLAAIAGVAFILMPQYEAVDRNSAVSTAIRARSALQREAAALSSVAGDWANWDDTFTYATKLNQDYVTNNLTTEALETINVDEFVITDLDGHVIRSHTAVQGADAPPSIAENGRIPAALWPNKADLPPRKKFSSVVDTPFGPAILALTRITDSRFQQSTDRILVLVRRIDESLLTELRRQADTSFSLQRHRQNGLITTSETGYRASVPVETYAKQSALQVSVDTPAIFSSLARDTIILTASLLLFISILACGVLIIYLRRTVTEPIEEIIRHSQRVSSTADLDRRLNFRRTDEIGALASAHDTMLGQLKQARIQLQEMSYAAGTSTLAADMLHNLRNTLAPIGTAVFKGREILKSMAAGTLVRASTEIANPAQDAERRTKLAAYIGAAARDLDAQRNDVERHFGTVQDFTGQIESILNHYEGISRGFKATEAVPVADIFETARKVIQGTASLPIEIAVKADVMKIPPVLAERVILRQIIENLSINAVQAVHAKGEPGKITLSAEDHDDHIELCVSDTGTGIDPQNLTRIFSRGVSTKEGRNRGLGLHYCATSIRAMNGKILAESNGPGQGATFRIQLPKAGTEGAAA